MSYLVNKNMFRQNDIRGVYGKDLTPELALDLGKAIGTFFGEGKQLFIGGDSRISTPILMNSIAAGILATGANIVMGGLTPSPIAYYASAIDEAIDGSLMITASHNPADQNGLKITDNKGVAFYFDNCFSKLLDSLRRKDFNEVPVERLGQLRLTKQYHKLYYDELAKKVPISHKMKVVIEVGNGACGDFVDFLKQLGHEVYGLRQEPDGSFPSFVPNPSKKETLVELRELLLAKKADLGIAFDGDGDRVGFLDELGEVISPDQVMMLFAKELLLKTPKSKLLLDCKTSRATFEFIKELNGIPLITRVGHSWVHKTLIEEKAIFAGELSAHYYFEEENYGFDDALFAAMKMMAYLSQEKRTLSEVISTFPAYYASDELRLPCEDHLKDQVITYISESIIKPEWEVIDVDGLRVELDDGWFLIRSSSTEPALSFRVEGTTPSKRDELYQRVQAYIKEALGALN
ncbi:MAG: phosphomannomutase/phosphoglucomutase [Candidatus Kariarchaeaceae archaeon]